jgi:hypothetical protein
VKGGPVVALLRTLGIWLSALLVLAGVAVALGLGAQPAGAAQGCLYTGSCSTLTTSTGSVAPGGTFVASGTGWKPGTTVTLDVCGLDTVTATASSAGDFSVLVTAPIEAGAGMCTITASGTASDDALLIKSTTIIISSSVGVTVPVVPTGEPWAGPLYGFLVGGVAVAGGGALVLGRRRRRAHT